jgi:hypothetical protein
LAAYVHGHFGENSLKDAIMQSLQYYLQYFHTARNHQGLENKIIDLGDEVGQIAGKVERRERLGGTLNYYYRDAA